MVDAPAFEAIAASSATFSTAPVQSQVSRLVEIQTLIINSLHAAAPCFNIDFGTPPPPPPPPPPPNSRSKIHYGGLLNHYCPLSSHLLSLASDHSVPESATYDSVHAGAANTDLPSKQAQQSLKPNHKEDDEFVSPELFEDPLSTTTTTVTTAAEDGGAGCISNSGAAADPGGAVDNCEQLTVMATDNPSLPPPPLKETITRLVSQGKLTHKQASGKCV